VEDAMMKAISLFRIAAWAKTSSAIIATAILISASPASAEESKWSKEFDDCKKRMANTIPGA
jgi:hypothetical protein